MEFRFTDENFDIKNLTNTELSGVNQFLLENNRNQLENLLSFYKSKECLMLVNGFIGVGKTQVVHHSFNFLSPKTLVLEYNCFETTILDDILLSFFEEFKEFAIKGIITQPKSKTENFTQKIASYFNTINLPIVIVINSFESVLKPNKQDILDFIFHLSSKENIKIIIISRKFDYEEFTIKYDKTTVLALEKNLYEKYLRSVGIKMIGPVSDELYKNTRGYFFYVALTAKIINQNDLTLIKFIDKYSKSFLTYNDFVLREALSLVDAVSGHLFRFLTIIRHPVSIKLLEDIKLYDETKIKTFIDNLLICKDKDLLYLQDYYKAISQNSVPENAGVKLHKSCMELYETQLPLKPFERDLLISRQTMRSEIEYHSQFIPKKPYLVKQLESAAVEAIGYAAELNNDYDSIPKTEEIVPQPDIEISLPENDNNEPKNISFIFENQEKENQIMDEIAHTINQYIDYSNKILTPEEIRLPFMELINAAANEETAYNYKKAIAFYQLTLTMKDDENYPLMISKIYIQTAKCYEKLSDWFNALKFYELALSYFVTAGDSEKMNEMRLSIANIFYTTYKTDKAELLLKEILSPNENISNDLKIRTYIMLATVKNNSIKDAYTNYKIAFSLIEPSTSKKILAELYYKFATVCDDIDETETAIILYKRCLDIQKENPYLAAACYNLAVIFEDTGAVELAVKYLKESLNTDKQNSNNNGIYDSLMRLANIYKHKNTDIAIEYYRQAINCAGKIKDLYSIVISNMEYGDLCADKKDFQIAIKAYIRALSKIKDKSFDNYKIELEQRLRDLKARLGEETFAKIESEILKNG